MSPAEGPPATIQGDWVVPVCCCSFSHTTLEGQGPLRGPATQASLPQRPLPRWCSSAGAPWAERGTWARSPPASSAGKPSGGGYSLQGAGGGTRSTRLTVPGFPGPGPLHRETQRRLGGTGGGTNFPPGDLLGGTLWGSGRPRRLTPRRGQGEQHRLGSPACA